METIAAEARGRIGALCDDEHPELDFDPLDDTKIWPETSSRCGPSA